MILEGGPCEFGIESTMVNLSDGMPSILRHGVVTREMLEETLGFTVPDAGKNAPRASGRLKSHYAPRTKLELHDEASLLARAAELSDRRLAVMAPADLLARLPVKPVFSIAAEADALAYGRALYENLHELDRAGAERILALRTPSTGPWAAVADRLGRAAA